MQSTLPNRLSVALCLTVAILGNSLTADVARARAAEVGTTPPASLATPVNTPTSAPSAVAPETNYYLGTVTAITRDGQLIDAQQHLYAQQVKIALPIGTTINAENDYTATASKLTVGQRVIILATVSPNQTTYSVVDVYRIPTVLWLVAIFFLLVILLARSRGFWAIIGLAFSLFVIIKWEIPAILAGHNPFLTSLGVAAVIAVVSLYLAHGFSKRTTLAVASTFITLVIAIGLAIGAVHTSHLTGQGSEESFYLQAGAAQTIDLIGLLLGGMIIGALGVLDDITTAQVAVVYELKHANPKLDFADLYRRGLSVGKEHIASLVNTLVLAYVGVALPLILLVVINQSQPVWVSLNSQYIIEEVVRALVGSAALVIAVPIATFLAAYMVSCYPNWLSQPAGRTHSHSS